MTSFVRRYPNGPPVWSGVAVGWLLVLAVYLATRKSSAAVVISLSLLIFGLLLLVWSFHRLARRVDLEHDVFWALVPVAAVAFLPWLLQLNTLLDLALSAASCWAAALSVTVPLCLGSLVLLWLEPMSLGDPIWRPAEQSHRLNWDRPDHCDSRE